MKKTKEIKLYNVIFPIWLLWVFPMGWIVVLPLNFVIDFLVLTIIFWLLKISKADLTAKGIVAEVWIFGFISDFIGAACMLLVNMIYLFIDEMKFGKWWHENLHGPINYNPFESVFALIWTGACVFIAGFFIYWFNYNKVLKKKDIPECQKKKIALLLAVFIAPYLFFLAYVIMCCPLQN